MRIFIIMSARYIRLTEYTGRVLIGQGKLDFASENANELVNPEQSLWKWKTVEDQLRSSL